MELRTPTQKTNCLLSGGGENAYTAVAAGASGKVILQGSRPRSRSAGCDHLDYGASAQALALNAQALETAAGRAGGLGRFPDGHAVVSTAA